MKEFLKKKAIFVLVILLGMFGGVKLILQRPLSSQRNVPEPVAQNLNRYEHAQNQYTFLYPPNWSDEPLKASEFPQVQYDFARMRSPDYRIAEGYPVLESGAEISVETGPTEETDIDMIFNKNPLAKDIAIGKTYTVVDGERAIQYDYSYETWNATLSEFIKNGNVYYIYLRYVDQEGKREYWDVYQEVLDSFQAR